MVIQVSSTSIKCADYPMQFNCHMQDAKNLQTDSLSMLLFLFFAIINIDTELLCFGANLNLLPTPAPLLMVLETGPTYLMVPQPPCWVQQILELLLHFLFDLIQQFLDLATQFSLGSPPTNKTFCHMLNVKQTLRTKFTVVDSLYNTVLL